MRRTRKYVTAKLGSELVLWINPKSVIYRAKGKYPVTWPIYRGLELLFRPVKSLRHLPKVLPDRFEPFVIPKSFYSNPTPLSSLPKHQKVKNFIQHYKNPQKTIWYKSLVNDLQEKGFAKHKSIVMHSQKDIMNFLKNYALTLATSLQNNGYQSKRNEIGNAYIGPIGEIHKSNGAEHRFYMAQQIGLNSIPVKINGVHEQWVTAQKLDKKDFNLADLAQAIRRIGNKYQ